MVRTGGIVIKIVFDADMLLFVALLNAEQEIEWDGEIWTKHLDLREAKVMFDDHVMKITELVLNHWNYEGDYDIVMCLTSTEGNYRKKIFEDYKANRKGKRKPMCFLPMRDYIREAYTTVEYPHLEADDCVGILCSGTDNIAVSGDKDFQSIPCKLYDFMRDLYFETTVEEADYFHLYQTLVGDTADGYKGCPKIGDVRAKRMLDASPTWETVVEAFEKNGSTEEEALVNARLAFILRNGYYNEETGEVSLWTPNTKDSSECETLKTTN